MWVMLFVVGEEGERFFARAVFGENVGDTG